MNKKKLTIILCIIIMMTFLTGCNNQKKELKNTSSSSTNNDKEITDTTKFNTTTNNTNGSEITNKAQSSTATTNKQKNDIDNSNSIFLVKFNLDGGSKFITYNRKNPFVTSYSLIVKNGETYGSASENKMLPDGEKNGYLFCGWYTDKNGKGEKITEKSVVKLKNNIELFAYWKESIKINYRYVENSEDISNGIYGSKSIEKGSIAADLKVAFKDIIYVSGYDFIGIYSNPECTNLIPDNMVLNNEDMIYIRHNAKIYNVYTKAIGNGKIISKSSTIATNESVKLELIPDEGYIPEHEKVCHGNFDNNRCQDQGILFTEGDNYIIEIPYSSAGGEGDLYITITFNSK